MKYVILFLALAIAATLGSLAIAQPLDKPTPLEDLAITPIARPAVAYDANSGGYQRKVAVPVWPWEDASKALSGVKPYENKGAQSPSFSSRDYDVGEGQGGSITGGSIAEWKDVVRKGPLVLIGIGVVVLLIGVAVVFFVHMTALGIAIGATGGAFITLGIMFESYPWIAPLVVLLGLGVAGWWLWTNRSLVQAKLALTAVAAAGEANPSIKADVAEAAKAMGAETVIRAAISKAKSTKAAITASKAASDAAKIKAATTG